MTKLITFLGVSRYDETEYFWNGKGVIAQFAPVASCQFMQATQVVVFATDDAEKRHGQALRDALTVPTQFISVLKGETEAELWSIFSKISENVESGEEIAFDVTHGLRSFPLVGLLAAAFLQTGLKVKLQAVFYGAFDVRDQSMIPNRTPMFDLTPMLTLLEWTAATDRFNRTGDARYFASLLSEQQKKLALQAQKEPERLAQIGRIGALASALTDISQSLNLIRPHLAMQQIEKLHQQAQAALPVLAQAEATLPFQMLLDSTLQSYETLALANPAADVQDDLRTQRAIIAWYADREHWAQAVSLSREWLVSWVMSHLGLKNLTVLSERQRIEGIVNTEAQEYVNAKKQEHSFESESLKTLPDLEVVLGLWKALTDVRNDIDHAGMRENPKKPNDLIKQIKAHIKTIQQLSIVNTLTGTRPKS